MLDKSELLKVFGNTASQVAVRFSGSLTTFFATLLIVSVMGISSLGNFVKITSFVSIFYLVVDFGINTVYLRDHFHKTEELFGNILYLRLLLSFIVFCVLGIIIWVLPTGLTHGFSLFDKAGVMIYALTLFTEGVLVSFSGVTQKNLLQKTLVAPSIISSLVVLALVSWGVFAHNLLLILVSYPLGEVIQIIFLFLMVRKKILFSLVPQSFYAFSKTTLIASVPLALMLFLNVVYFRVDTIILSFFKANADVGAYGFSYKIFEFLLVVPTFLAASIFPILIALKENKNEFQKRITSYSALLAVSSVVIAIVVFLLAPSIVLIRSDLASAITPLQILCFSLPFFFLTSLFQWVLLLRGQVKLLIGIYLVTMVINIWLNVSFIPQYSYNAAAVVTVITEGIVFLAMLMVFSLSSVKKSSKPNAN